MTAPLILLLAVSAARAQFDFDGPDLMAQYKRQTKPPRAKAQAALRPPAPEKAEDFEISTANEMRLGYILEQAERDKPIRVKDIEWAKKYVRQSMDWLTGIEMEATRRKHWKDHYQRYNGTLPAPQRYSEDQLKELVEEAVQRDLVRAERPLIGKLRILEEARGK